MSRLGTIVKKAAIIVGFTAMIGGCTSIDSYVQPEWAVKSEYIGPVERRLTKQDLLDKTIRDFKSSNLFNSEYFKYMETKTYSVEQKMPGGVNDLYTFNDFHSTLFVDNGGNLEDYMDGQFNMLSGLTHVEAHYMWNEVLSEDEREEFGRRILEHHLNYDAIHKNKEFLPPVEENPEIHKQFVEAYGFTPDTFESFRHYRELRPDYEDLYEEYWHYMFFVEEAYTTLIQFEMTNKLFIVSVAKLIDESSEFSVDEEGKETMQRRLNTITMIPSNLIEFYRGFIHDRYFETDSLKQE